jgi:cell division protein FtsZ
MQEKQNQVAILGLGGGGCRIVSALSAAGLPSATRIALADTDLSALNQFTGMSTLFLGEKWTGQDGCGGDTALGEKAIGASSEALQSFIGNAHLLIVVSALGGGTGSGGINVVARLAREAKIPTFVLVTLPFSFEGNYRRREAERSLDSLRKISDAVILVSNDLLFGTLPADTSAAAAFRLADKLLAEGIAGLAQLNSPNGLIPADFTSLRTVLRQRHAASTLGVGHGRGELRWQQALETFCQSPLLGGEKILSSADVAVVTIVGGEDLKIDEIKACLEAIQKKLRPEVRLIVGAYTQPGLDEFRLSGLICRYQDQVAGGLKPANLPSPDRNAPKGTPIAKQATEVQGELPLMEQPKGMFAGTTPTTRDGQNLDVPPFLRKGISLNLDFDT